MKHRCPRHRGGASLEADPDVGRKDSGSPDAGSRPACDEWAALAARCEAVSRSALADLQIPYFAIAVSAAINIHGWWKGTIPLTDLPLEVVVDGALSGALAVAGGFAGKAIGALLFGPAGGVIFSGVGQAAAILAKDGVRQKFDDLRARAWIASVGEAADGFRSLLGEAMQSKIESIEAKASELTVSDERMEDWMRLKFQDQALGVAECVADLDDLPDQPLDRARALLQLTREAGIHHQSVQASLKGLTEALQARPSVTDQVVDVAASVQRKLGDRLGSKSGVPREPEEHGTKSNEDCLGSR